MEFSKTCNMRVSMHDGLVPGGICKNDLDYVDQYQVNMTTSSNGNIFRVTVPLCGEFAGDRWIPLTVNNRYASDLRRRRAHHDVTVIISHKSAPTKIPSAWSRLGEVCLVRYHVSYMIVYMTIDVNNQNLKVFAIRCYTREVTIIHIAGHGWGIFCDFGT